MKRGNHFDIGLKQDIIDKVANINDDQPHTYKKIGVWAT